MSLEDELRERQAYLDSLVKQEIIKQYSPTLTSRDACMIVECLKYLETHVKQGIDLQQVSDVAHLSKFHFHRIFKSFTGYTQKEVRMRLQIREAKLLLLKGKPISEVAMICGFSQQSHFTDKFRRATGSTPLVWQRDRGAIRSVL